jgi:hypothetical protein
MTSLDLNKIENSSKASQNDTNSAIENNIELPILL